MKAKLKQAQKEQREFIDATGRVKIVVLYVFQWYLGVDNYIANANWAQWGDGLCNN